MSSAKKPARIAGLLIILGIVMGILSIVPSIEGVNYLTEVYPQRNQTLTGAVFQFLLVPIYIGFSLILYQFLKDYKENLALGFIGFRLMAGVFQLLGVILIPLFIYLSQQYLNAAPSELAHFETLGELLKLFRDLTNHLGVMLATGLGNLILYYIFLKGAYLPRWLSIWGVLGNVLIMLASFLILFQVTDVISTTYIVLTIPVVLQEIVLAIWLIVKGLDLSIVSRKKP
jgi:hypothetical protein